MIEKSLHNLMRYIESENYKGLDPYDALNSPLFNLPFLKTNKYLRFGTQQFIKRLPLNIRPLLFIDKGLNPATLGLCIQSYSYMLSLYPGEKEIILNKINTLIESLVQLIPEGFSGACWGYNFDWEARYAKIPAYKPTVVATGIITNGLFECYKITGIKKVFTLCETACNFILHDLNRFTADQSAHCFSYSPYDNQLVFNANMKGARLLSQVYSVTKDQRLLENANKAVNYTLQNQNIDGSWFYSKRDNGSWIDNYHTGYVLDCLHEFYQNCNIIDNGAVRKGFDFYMNTMIDKSGMPKFFSDRSWPADCTSGSQTILTLCRFNEIDLATRVAGWLIENMQDRKGFFYYRKYRTFTIRTSYMRWSNAWMAAALSYLLYKTSTRNE